MPLPPSILKFLNKLMRRDDWVGGESVARAYLIPVLKPFIRLAAETRDLVPCAVHTVKVALEGRSYPLSAQVQARLLNRIATELRVAETAALNSYGLQAMTVTSVIFEHAHVIGYIGSNDSKADEWLQHTKTDRSYPEKSMRKIVAGSLREQELPDHQLDVEMGVYEIMCMAKHGNPQVLMHHGVTTAPGEMTLHHGPFVNRLTPRLGLEALAEGTRLAIMAIYCFCKPRLTDKQSDFATRVVDLLDRAKDARTRVLTRLEGDW